MEITYSIFSKAMALTQVKNSMIQKWIKQKVKSSMIPLLTAKSIYYILDFSLCMCEHKKAFYKHEMTSYILVTCLVLIHRGHLSVHTSLHTVLLNGRKLFCNMDVTTDHFLKMNSNVIPIFFPQTMLQWEPSSTHLHEHVRQFPQDRPLAAELWLQRHI